MLGDISLFLLATLASTLAGVFVMGGGMLMVLVLPWFVPAIAVVPVHAVTQLASNSSRLVFAFEHIYWPAIGPYLFGSVAGTSLFAALLLSLPFELIPPFIAIYLLLSLWCVPFTQVLRRLENFFLAGFLQTGLGLVVGAPGPIALTMLSRRLENRESIVATASLMMLCGNLFKIGTFLWLGFHFADYWWPLVLTVAGACLGSLFGSLLRRRIAPQAFMLQLKWLLTLMALTTLLKSLLWE
ncbi:sulfite exporter TauE/SafE family protein [Bowmanella yangjiangensis]|uniref:Probable membrane transporter protein n=1 Tax=Bowmanella yangjiangensis TaxID=2811230 RepID=A0ABS3CRC1_9ALTE|nr:sulfite exporter TauE/SafE family protein [Bowmanella yangjiangensis]MBN7819664.1 sulfite exporter TauE/SafE family protein [Bowmanella yangjiangensis]